MPVNIFKGRETMETLPPSMQHGADAGHSMPMTSFVVQSQRPSSWNKKRHQHTWAQPSPEDDLVAKIKRLDTQNVSQLADNDPVNQTFRRRFVKFVKGDYFDYLMG